MPLIDPPRKRAPTSAPRTDAQSGYRFPKPPRTVDHTPAPSRVFGPVGRVDQTITAAQHHAAQQARRAASRLPSTPQLKRFPLLPHYTPAQQQTIIREQLPRLHAVAQSRGHVQAALADQRANPGVRVPSPIERVYAESNAQDRQQIALLSRLVGKQAVQHPMPANAARLMPAHQQHGLAGVLHAASAGLDARVFGGQGGYALPRLLNVPVQTARVLVTHPSSIPKTISGLGELVVGGVAGVPELGVQTVTGTVHGDPLRAARNVYRTARADYQRRYGPLLAGNTAAFRRRLQQEGAAPELVDIATVAAPEGAVLGRGLGAAARAGALGERAARFASEARPALRLSGSTVRAQDLSPNLFRAAGQRAEDVIRRHAAERRASQARAKGVGVPGLQAGPGEVTRATLRGQDKAQRVLVAQRQGRAFVALRAEQSQEVHRGATQAIAGLNRQQRRSVFHVLQGLVTPDDPAAAVQQLRARRAQLIAQGAGQPARVLGRTHDELAAIDHLIQHAPEIFTPRLRDFQAREAQRSIRLERQDPGVRNLTAEARRLRPQGDFLAIPYEYEHARTRLDTAARAGQITPEQHAGLTAELERRKPAMDARYVETVRRVARAHGLPEPAFVPHTPRPFYPRSDYAPGGMRAIQGPRQTSMALFRSGRADVSPQAYVQGVARSVKRRQNWQLVADQFDAHSLPHLFDERTREPLPTRDRSIEDLRRAVDRAGLDPGSWAFWNPGRYRSHATEAGTAALTPAGDSVGLSESLRDAALTPEQLDAHLRSLSPQERARFVTSRGWSLVPRQVFEELSTAANPSHAAGRLVDKAQAVQSRVLLGNPGWLQMQIAANALLTGFGVRGNLPDIGKAQAWYRSLPPDLKRAVDEHLGTGMFEHRPPHLGAASDHSLVNFWRAVRSTAFMQRASRANPLDLVFRADNAQTNAFKRAVLYNRVKREAYRRMGRDVGRLAALQDRLTHVLTLGPRERMEAVLMDPALFEKHAQATLDLLGDYATYTARERRTLKRGVLFYGFLRYATRMLFRTMPIGHPIVTAAVAKLAQLHNAEVRDLLGGPQAPWAYSRVFFGSKGDLRSIDFARINPVTNPVVNLVQEGPKAVGGLLSPVVQSALDLAYRENLFTGLPLRVKGSAEQAQSVDPVTAARVMAGDLLSTSWPYRELVKTGIPGVTGPQTATQGDDALLFSARPLRYRTPQAQQAEAQRRQRKGTPGEQFMRDLFPLTTTRPDNTPDVVAKIQRQQHSLPASRSSLPGSLGTIVQASHKYRAKGSGLAPQLRQIIAAAEKHR